MNEHKCTLTSLYPSLEIRAIVRSELTKVFNYKYLIVIDECVSFRPYLVLPIKFYYKELRNMFIEEGIQMDCAEDMEEALENLGYLKWERFHNAKENFQKSAKIISMIKKKQLRFNLGKNKVTYI